MTQFLSAVVLIFLCTKFSCVLSYEAYIVPMKYKISLTPYIENEVGNKMGTYDGTADIYIRSKWKGVKHFYIPSDDLLYTKMDLRNLETDEIIPSNFSYGTNRICFTFDEELDESALYIVELAFHGTMGGNNALKWDLFTDHKGERSVIVWSEMGMSNTKSVFPCFTETYYRVRYEITVILPVGYDGYSNGAMHGSSVQDYYNTEYVYQQTPEIPSYLVSIVVLKSSRHLDHWIKVRLVKESPDKSTATAEEVFLKASNFYELTFRRSYSSLGTPTFIAIGHYKFARNSYTQTWGVGLFDEELLTSDAWTTTAEEQTMKTKLSSAMGQVWYANAICPKTWSDSWVNRALTKYYEYMGTHEIYPKLHLDVQFVTEEMHPVMWLENYNVQLTFSSNDFYTKDYSDAMMNSWLYGKAASVLRMFSHAMTQPRFTDMMRNLIAKNFSGTFTETDLKESILLYWPSSSNVNADEFYEQWVNAVGVPAINVSISADKKSARFTRIRDCIYIPVPQNFPTIPLTYITDKTPNSTDTFSHVYMHSGQDSVTVNFTEPINWIIANNHRVGFYRVLYPEGAYEVFRKELMKAGHSQIHQLNRAQFIDDLFYFHMCKFVTSKTLLNFLQYLTSESDYAPWKAAMEGFIHLSTILDAKDLPYLEEYVWFLSGNIYNDLGIFPKDRETALQRHLRNLILNTNCRFRQQNISDRALEMVWELTKTKENDIPREILTTIICCGARRLTNQEYSILLDIYEHDPYTKYTRSLFDGMACTHSPLSLERYFNKTRRALPVAEREAIFTKILRENPNNAWFLYLLLTKNFYKLLDTFHNKIRLAHILRSIGIFLDHDQFLHWEAYMDRNIDQYPQVIQIPTTVHYARRFHNLFKFERYFDLKEYLRNRVWMPVPVVSGSGSIQIPTSLKFFMMFIFFKYTFLFYFIQLSYLYI